MLYFGLERWGFHYVALAEMASVAQNNFKLIQINCFCLQMLELKV